MKINTQYSLAAIVLALTFFSVPVWSAPEGDSKKQPLFASPDDAAAALVEAVRNTDAASIIALMGPDSDDWLFTGDDVADKEEWMRFLEAWDENHAISTPDDDYAVLLIGDEQWAFPAPIVMHNGQWRFDSAVGRAEVVNRRVGRNELNAIQVLLAAADAQREYARRDADGDGFHNYADRFISSEGEKDGLYWPVQPGEPQSPLGPLIGVATSEGYRQGDGTPQPYHGYLFRLLTEHGADAPGGAYNYVVNDRLLGGFALLAYPANYGVSGVMTLMVAHDGIVYQKDLGDATATTAAAIQAFNPDASWTKAE